jgi:two-component system, LytTR family, response regulator AlgR
MDSLRLLIVDDEPLARLRLRGLLADCGGPALARVVGEAGSAAEALHLLSLEAVDGLLLDIHMPGLDGLELARRLKALSQPPAVVFVTAHAEHALSAFELDAVDYLTKPVRRARLQEALGRIAQRLNRPPATPPPTAPMAVVPEAATLVVSDRGRMLRIPVAEVVYLRAEMKYVTLRTTQHVYVLDDALADLEQRLGPAVVRIHRNAVVAKGAVRALEKRPLTAPESDESGEGWAVRLAPFGEWLPVSRRQLAAVREALTAGGV